MKFILTRRHYLLTIVLGTAVATAWGSEFQVSVGGNDANNGSLGKPFRTISEAARVAQPGDVITVHQGVYREAIDPPRGGESDFKRITYQTAPGEKVEITGSERVTNWVKVNGIVWKVTVANTLFGGFNPFGDLIRGDWFYPKGTRKDHTGAVYLNGDWLTESSDLDEVMKPLEGSPLWFANVGKATTTIWAQFEGIDPNEEQVEINVRRTVFYPKKTGINFITLRGFILEQAATPWAPPTTEQIGLVGTNWSKGWIIENNVVRYSICSGIALGKYGDEADNSPATAEGYVATIRRALVHGWNSATVGHHIVRNNDISRCEQAGIVGSLGAAFSIITGNTIHEIHVRKLFDGAEIAGIKFHGAIDVQIVRNHVYNSYTGLWLDWMAQGARVSQNLFNDNSVLDLLLEVNHGPIVVDNNIFLSPWSLDSRSQGVAFVHNLFGGKLEVVKYDDRLTPFHRPHSTDVAGFHDNPRGDDRYYNNIFMGSADLSPYDDSRPPAAMNGNLFLGGAKPSQREPTALVEAGFDADLALLHEPDGDYLAMRVDPAWNTKRVRDTVTTASLGHATVPDAAFEQPDGSPFTIGFDYFGHPRDLANPSVGPFETVKGNRIKLKVWPRTSTE